MSHLTQSDPVAAALTAAIQSGNTAELKRLLDIDPALVNARIVDGKGCGRTPLHIAVDWPGNFPNAAETIRVLAAAGADVNAKFEGASNHGETPLHGAASCDDAVAVDALLDAGADIEAPGAVLGGGSAMADAAGFLCLKAAARLLERGAKTSIGQAAALGLMDRLENYVSEKPSETELGNAFWMACHGSQLEAAQYLLANGASLNWIPFWEPMTPLDAAVRSKASDVIDWLISNGAKHAVHL